MKTLLITALLLSSTALANAVWWERIDYDMIDLLERDYRIVSVTSTPESNGMTTNTVVRFVLTRDKAVAVCWEIVSSSGRIHENGCKISRNAPDPEDE